MVDNQGDPATPLESSTRTDKTAVPSSQSPQAASVHQSVQQDGKYNTAIAEGSDVRIGGQTYYGPTAYYGPSAEQIRTIVQATLQGQNTASMAASSDTPVDETALPVLDLQPHLAERINSRLAALYELHKLGQLSPQHVSDFNQVRNKVISIMTLQDELAALAMKADTLLKAGVNSLTDKLEALESNQSTSLAKARSQAYLQEQINLLKQFQENLEDGKVVAYWLAQEREDGLASKLGQHALNHFPNIQESLSSRQIDAFYLTLNQLLENLSHCLTWGRKNSLENPVTPVVVEG
ncbi:MAG: hypothetical protein F6K00_01225 [Leptolyngbya sp. SIOISBB]|nr:hypothetical protein [Leptolyngbya sp. SIOISBB]